MTRTEAQRLTALLHKLEAFTEAPGRHVGGGIHVDLSDGTKRGWTTALVKAAEKVDTTDPLNPTPTGDYHVPGLERYDLADATKLQRLSAAEQAELAALEAKRSG